MTHSFSLKRRPAFKALWAKVLTCMLVAAGAAQAQTQTQTQSRDAPRDVLGSPTAPTAPAAPAVSNPVAKSPAPSEQPIFDPHADLNSQDHQQRGNQEHRQGRDEESGA